MERVVFPEPPFWFTAAMIFAGIVSYRSREDIIVDTIYTVYIEEGNIPDLLEVEAVILGKNGQRRLSFQKNRVA
jgi:hypothetical protein